MLANFLDILNNKMKLFKIKMKLNKCIINKIIKQLNMIKNLF